MNSKFYDSFSRLKAFCEKEGFKGYDPYDGLNSRFFQAIPFAKKNRFLRLAWIQAFKKAPINLRPFTGVKKEYNPKAMGIFLSGYCQLYKMDPQNDYLEKIRFFIEKITNSVSPGYSGSCWGYNFDWQARAFYQPKFTPTVVASTFIANALLDAYEIVRDPKLLDMARSTCDFVLKDLNRTYDKDGDFAFSYSPADNSVVFNASLLGSRILSRVYHYTGEQELYEEARKSVAFCCKHQKPDGSWSYGTYDFHQWIDNFHTGYNLECISDFQQYTKDESFNQYLEAGFNYYINTFFTAEGISKYYSNTTYPVDIHAPTQLIITLVKMNRFKAHRKLIDKVIHWTIDNMQDKKGYFYYQVNKYFSSRIPYMRWSQSWMFYAMTIYFNQDQPTLKKIQQKAHENVG
ncbi:hypothetical protein [Flavihumibacter fluvii]|uniref:hypothetical protein n=1 Tax=Flavihumibacter fluvii TaxID=2838157 RepID=UPI001BDE3034|nr:hypothetical protein [Flavihumibacter fluvii]ULQ54431.1 hypothetical protein KJS93_08885 [Flavihumibacter fluvii]